MVAGLPWAVSGCLLPAALGWRVAVSPILPFAGQAGPLGTFLLLSAGLACGLCLVDLRVSLVAGCELAGWLCLSAAYVLPRAVLLEALPLVAGLPSAVSCYLRPAALGRPSFGLPRAGQAGPLGALLLPPGLGCRLCLLALRNSLVAGWELPGWLRRGLPRLMRWCLSPASAELHPARFLC
jgi:hypothetical protein